MTVNTDSALRQVGQPAVTWGVFRRREAARPKIGRYPGVSRKIPFGRAVCDRDKLLYFVSAEPAVTVTAEQFELVQ